MIFAPRGVLVTLKLEIDRRRVLNRGFITALPL